MPFKPRLVYVTAPTLELAQALAKGLLEKRYAACVNLIPGVESRYWWEGKLETSTEVQMIIKSSAEKFDALEEYIIWHHTYKCPEIVAVEPDQMLPGYRAWWDAAMRQPAPDDAA